jgi:hypothetical protein
VCDLGSSLHGLVFEGLKLLWSCAAKAARRDGVLGPLWRPCGYLEVWISQSREGDKRGGSVGGIYGLSVMTRFVTPWPCDIEHVQNQSERNALDRWSAAKTGDN